MHKLHHLLKLIRWPNLVMTCVGIISIWYFLIYKTNSRLILQVDFPGILMLCISFVLVMGAGYIVNDIFDIEIDVINKPHKRIIGKYYSTMEGWFLYLIFNLAAIVFSIFAAFVYQKTSLLLLLPIGILALFIYSKWLKKRAPWGNLLIGVLGALALWLPAFSEWNLVKENALLFDKFFACSLIAGMCMLMREIVKSQEDFEGDKSYGARTLPILLGMDNVRKLIMALNLMTIILIICIVYYFHISLFPSIAIVITMVCPLIGLQIVFILKSSSARFFLQSNIIKIIMAAGMIILPWALSNFQT